MGVHEDETYAWMPVEKVFLKDVIARNIPTFGICLGAQLIADVLDADVSQNPFPEIGFFPVMLTQAAAGEHFFSNIPKTFTPFHWHSDTFLIPKGASRIAGNNACMNQGFIGPGRVLGLQFHLETDTQLINEWRDRLPAAADPPYVQAAEQITDAAAKQNDENYTILRTLLDRFYITVP